MELSYPFWTKERRLAATVLTICFGSFLWPLIRYAVCLAVLFLAIYYAQVLFGSAWESLKGVFTARRNR